MRRSFRIYDRYKKAQIDYEKDLMIPQKEKEDMNKKRANALMNCFPLI